MFSLATTLKVHSDGFAPIDLDAFVKIMQNFYRHDFNTIDTDGDGTINAEEFFKKMEQAIELCGHYLETFTMVRVNCNRKGSVTLETAQPKKPTPSGFRTKNLKIRLAGNIPKHLKW